MIYIKPNIEIDSNSQIILSAHYKKYLSDKIKLVCSKVGFTYKNIKWIIFDPKVSDIYGNKPNNIEKLLVGSKGKDYGACNLKDTIWISTLAIQTSSLENSSIEKINKIINPNKKDLLADVILDEITHFSTKSNHGNAKYDTELVKLKNLYYNSIFSNTWYTK